MMHAALKVASEALAGMDHRHSPEGWMRRAWEVTRDQGPLDDVDERILSYLESRMAAATEREALGIQLQVFRQSGGLPDVVAAAARVRIAAEGGITHEHAQELGYGSVADFLVQRPEEG